jgi:predicted Zn-dependent protease
MDIIENLKKLIAGGKDSALARFGIGNEYLRRSEPAEAIVHLEAAVSLDPAYSAAWKLLGKARLAQGLTSEAIAAWESGIAAAGTRGDKQAVREMEVFLKRARRSLEGDAQGSA